MYDKATYVTGLYPNAEKVNNASAALISGKADRFFDTESAELPHGANADMLGANYANYTGDYAISDKAETSSYYQSQNRILFYAKKDSTNQANTFDISDYDGFYFNVYYKSVKADGSLGFFVVAENNNTNIYGSVVSVTKASQEGKWVTYTDEDVCQGGLEAIKTKFGEYGFAALMVNLADNLDIEAYVGSIVFYKNADNSSLDITSDNFLTEMRNADLLLGLGNTEQFINTIIDNTNALAEEFADNEELINKIKFADDCNAYGGVDLRDLARMARHIDDTSVKIDKLAADGNCDGSVDSNDEELLRTKLLNR